MINEFKRLSKIKRKAVHWLWEPYIPRGMMTIMEGDPDVGKSFLAMHIASEISKGGTLPDGTKLQKGRVLYFSQEDDPAYTIRPRIEDMGGSVKNIKVHIGDSVFDEDGLQVLRNEALIWKPDLIIIDPLVGYIDPNTNFHKSNEIRSVLRALADVAAEVDCGLLVIRHLTKGKQDKAIYQGGGSIDFIAFVRSAIRVAQHPENPNWRILVHFKHNLSLRGDSMSYEIVEQKSPKMPKVVWRGKADFTINDLHDGPAKQQSELERAVAFLNLHLADGPLGSTDLMTQAEAYQISKKTLERAKVDLGVASKKKGKKWVWILPQPSKTK